MYFLRNYTYKYMKEDNMETKLKKLFDYQKFAQNENLNRIIKESSISTACELSDEVLFSVAGGKQEEDLNNVEKINK